MAATTTTTTTTSGGGHDRMEKYTNRSPESAECSSINTEKSPQHSGSGSSNADESERSSWSTRRFFGGGRGGGGGAISHVHRMITVDRANHHLHITGLRGILVIQSFFWTYFQTFIPTLVSRDTPGAEYQDLLREILSVPLWNASLISNFFIILSMRTIAVSFLTVPTGPTYAASIIRRNVRMVIILSAGSGLATLIFSRIGTQFIDEFKRQLPNTSIVTPTTVYDGGAAFNSLFNLFWLTYDHYTQAANMFWPTATLWAPSIIYFQSYTVYFLMVILPFTRPQWHWTGMGLFGLGSFWMGYWGWYSVTGLLLADLAVNTTLRGELERGGVPIPIGGGSSGGGGDSSGDSRWRVPHAAIACALFAGGIGLKYAFVVRPQYIDKLLVLHPYLDLSSRYSPATQVAAGPYARLDDWMVIVGVLLGVEMCATAQYVLSFKPLVYLGERSFSIFVAQCIFFWTGGIKLWLVLHDDEKKNMSTSSANGVVFLVGVLAVAVFSELFFRVVDVPSVWLARGTYTWLVD